MARESRFHDPVYRKYSGIGTGLLIFALCLHVVCLATDHWLKLDWARFAEYENTTALREQIRVGEPLIGDDVEYAEAENVMTIFDALDLGPLFEGRVVYGLWEMCRDLQIFSFFNLHLDCYSFDEWDQKTEDWMRPCRTLGITGVVFLLLALCGSFLPIVVKSKGDRRRYLYLLVVVLSVLAAIFILIGDIIVATKLEDVLICRYAGSCHGAMTLSWGFIVDIIAVIIILAAAASKYIGGQAQCVEGGGTVINGAHLGGVPMASGGAVVHERSGLATGGGAVQQRAPGLHNTVSNTSACCSPGGSFPAGTMLHTPGGYINARNRVV